MSKKTSKAKPRAKRPRIIKVFQLGLFGGKKLIGRHRAPTKAEQAASDEFHRQADEYFASDEFRQFKVWEAEQRQRHRDRIARRPAEMRRRDYALPADVAAFVMRLRDDPLELSNQNGHVPVIEAREMIEDAYMEGCRQGFIEGFLYGEDKARPGALRNRERLRQQNIEKLQRLGIADRNAEIVTEFHRLERDLPGKEQRYEELAARHNLTTRQIGNIVRRAPKRRR